MTVSKVLRDAPDISAATKARVKALSQQMGYVPDSMAQSLRNRTTKLFGLVISATTNPVSSRVVMAIEEHAYEMGFDVILAHSMNNLEREEHVIRRLLSRRVDGLFITPVYRLEPNARIYDELAARGSRVVLLGHRAPFCNRFCAVETDDIQASYTATRHLVKLGHRRIAYFAGSSSSPPAQERFEGYKRALREDNIALDDRLIFNAGATIEEGEKAALQLLQERPGATAVQAVNDLVAIGASETFLNQGLRIPQDLSIVGFGNILTSEYFRVPLTTIRQPKYRMGAAAMESMQRLLRGERVETKRLQAEIAVRASAGPPHAESRT